MDLRHYDVYVDRIWNSVTSWGRAYMTDNALKNARDVKSAMAARIQKLEEEMKQARANLARAERFIAEYQAFESGDSEGVEQATPLMPGLPDENRTPAASGGSSLVLPRPKNPKKEDVAAATVSIIRERGVPVMRDELFDALSERGIHIYGKNPQMVLSTMLWRQPKVVARLKRGGYWPAEDEVPEGEEVVSRDAEE
ncbi:hypothetical protein ACX9MO_10040 [Pseudooceanicola sp. 502str34]